MSYVWSFLFVVCGDLVAPFTMGLLVDALIRPQPSSVQVYSLAGWTIGALLGAFVMARLTFWCRNRVATNTERRLNLLVFDAYERQEYNFFASNFVGALVAQAQRFVNTFRELYDTSIFSLLNIVVKIVGPVIILAFRAPLLAVIFVLSAATVIGVIALTNRYKATLLRQNAQRGSEVTGALADVLTNNLAIKVFAAAQRERQRFFGVAEQRRQTYYRLTRATEHVRMARTFFATAFQIVFILTLSYLALHHKISIGTILTAQLYMARLENSLWDISRLAERVEEAMADATQMTKVIMRQPKVQDVSHPLPLQVTAGEIKFSKVTFAYQDSQTAELFSGLNLNIPAGQKVGLVGPSGGGKTSLTKLILRFEDLTAGQILIDGQDIAQVRQADLRLNIAYVPQEPLLFHRSIRENIAYGNAQASDAAVMQAAELAHATEFISKLPQGFDTLVGERGIKLSGGEKQRVAIARAMLKQAPIVVLDEATSALDSRSEKAIVGALDNLMRRRTTIVIAHRLSTIRKLDRIVVLKGGRIVEDGPHHQLLQAKGLYAELWQHQSGEFLPES